ncbi:ATP-binding protein [Neptuniibacter sp. 1_MG-2023]|uniref:sensor histidine kinase n=1 Tax=Neptuniibacter sp. 1_MG-2023 TaxID=3062662 RepID=UPI0026E42724|nr:ATP-binding protein [Neptuniibacter sp. 1_MG-2023]MDO6593483.1 ATP-binding protein [Neptuniibacter sp. 1_MG-2023]
MSLRLKTILGIAIIQAVLLLLLVSMTLHYLRTTNYESLSKRASTTATLFATTAANAVLSYDLASLDAFVSEVMKNSDLVYARVLGPDNQLFAEDGEANILSRPFVLDTDVEKVNDSIFDTYAEISEGGVVYGRVEIGIDTDSLSTIIDEATNRSATIAAVGMLFVALFSSMLGTYLTSQLKYLRAAARSISKGDLAIKIPINGRDEIADVAHAFNSMASDLKDASLRRDQFEAELSELNRSLEDRVKRRTEALEKANSEIKSAQTQLIQSEKMASIGVLSAGVAHEINNPLGFVISNLSTLDIYAHNYRALVTEYQRLLEINDTAEREEQLNKIQDLIKSIDLEFMNEDLDDLLKDTHEGSVRVKEIVKGLKAFSHTDQTGRMQLADINECITSTLKVVNNELKYHCTISTSLSDIPQIYCLPSQIKQVLLNIILNAGHAIQGQGVIDISSNVVEDHIEIRIKDDGCGIAEDEINKLFDPFYTTKKVGEGTGLGLAISYGIIVDDHHGEINVQSEEGKGTCFTIILPIVTEPPNEEDDSVVSA